MIQLLSAVVLLALANPSDGRADAAWATATVARLNALLEAPNSERADAADRLVREHLAVDEFAAATFGDYLEESLDAYRGLLSSPRFTHLVEHYRGRLARAYQHRLSADLAVQLASPDWRGLRLDSLEVNGQRGRAQLRALFATRSLGVEADLIFANGTWKIAELKIDGRPVSSHYRRRYQSLIDRGHSPPVLEAQLAEREYVVLEDFTATWDGSQPMEWGPWKKTGSAQTGALPRRGSLAALHGGARFEPFGHRGKIRPVESPPVPDYDLVLAGCGLAAGRQRVSRRRQRQCGGVYVIFSKNWMGVPKQLKYVWSTTLPEGTVGRRDKLFRPWFFVVESGAANLGKWTFEVVDLEKHHREKLGGRPAKRTIGLGLLTDANSTRSYAEAYYADLRVWTRQAFDGGRVVNHCGGLPVSNGAYSGENSQ